MRFFLQIFIFTVVFISCKRDYIDVSKIEVDFKLERFDVDFYTSTIETLKETKKKYPLLFPKKTSDSVWISKIEDKDEKELFAETQKIYKNFYQTKEELLQFFKHVKYYNNRFKTPDVITILSNIDYDNRVIYADSLLLISLDVYLGKNHKFYTDYPKYIKENNTKNNIIVDVANSVIEKQLSALSNRSFISKIIHEGKKMYLLDMYLPTISDKFKIGYTEEKLNWAIENEESIWMYFVEKNLLFSTDTKLNKRFLDNAPFSKFYLEQDNLSPGRIGVWLGWQIVKSYMQNNDVSLQELLTIDSEELFKKSKYKPRK